MDNRNFFEEDIDSAEKFLDCLRPSHPSWSGRSQLWGFRGQSDAIWHLVPSAFREDFQNYLPREKQANDDDKWKAQQRNEFFAFEDFVRLADQIALYVPGIGYLLSEVFESRKDIDLQWPFSDGHEFVEGFAIAQHHGVPTRLLDFTYNPFVAAYFAAYDRYVKKSEERKFESERFSVWAVNVLFLKNAWQDWRNRRIQIVEVPTSRNLFLNAQRGFFIYDSRANEAWPPKPLDHVILTYAETERAWEYINDHLDEQLRGYAKPVLRKFNLLASEAGRVLIALYEQERLSQAHLMPTLDNVVRTYGFMRDLRAKMQITS